MIQKDFDDESVQSPKYKNVFKLLKNGLALDSLRILSTKKLENVHLMIQRFHKIVVSQLGRKFGISKTTLMKFQEKIRD